MGTRCYFLDLYLLEHLSHPSIAIVSRRSLRADRPVHFEGRSYRREAPPTTAAALRVKASLAHRHPTHARKDEENGARRWSYLKTLLIPLHVSPLFHLYVFGSEEKSSVERWSL